MTFLITVHGNFELVRDVWIFVSNLCASNGYRGIIYAVFVLSVTIAAARGPFSVLAGDRLSSMTSWVRGFFIAVFLYYVFLGGSARVKIYDDVTQQQHTQGNIPTALAMTAGIVNGLAVEIEDLIKNYLTTPVPIEDVGYDRGTVMLKETFVGVLRSVLAAQIDPQMVFSAQQYAADCVAIKAAREASYKATLERTNDMKTSWAGAAHPALFTYTGLDASGNPLASGANQNVSCQEAWNRMNSYFNSSSAWNDSVKAFCDAMLYDSGDPLSLAACKKDYQNSVKQWVLGGMSKTMPDILKDVFLSQIWNLFLANLGNHEAAITEGYALAGARSASGGLLMNTWIPTAKTLVFSLIVGLLPILAIFMVTPYGLDAVKFMFGLFLWWGIWCGVDMMMSVMWLNRLNELFAIVSSGGQIGIKGLGQLWPLADRALTLMGNMRAFGILLSSGMAYGVFRFGGSAMAQLARGFMGPLEGGSASASGYLGPHASEERARDFQEVKNAEAYSATLQTANVMGGPGMMARTMGRAQATEQVSGAYQYTTEAGNLGVPGLARKLGTAKASREIQSVSQAMSMGGPAGATVVGGLAGTKALSNAMAYQNVLDRVKKEQGKDDLQAATWLSQAEHARQYGTNAAFWKEYSRMRSLGVIDRSFSPLDYAVTKSYLSSLPGAGKAFSLRDVAAKAGKAPAALELARASFGMARNVALIETLARAAKNRDWGQVGRLMGEMEGLSNTYARTLDMVKGDPDMAKYVTLFEATQNWMNEFSRFAVRQVVSDHLSGKATKSQLRTVLGYVASRPEGQTMIQEFLKNRSFSGISTRQTRHFIRMALREPDMRDINIKPGDNVVASFKYDPEKEELGLTDIRVSHAAQEVRGSRVEHRNREAFDQPRSFWVHGDLLGTGKKGFYHVVGQGRRTGHVIDLERAFIQAEDGKYMPVPMKLSMTLDPTYENPGQAFEDAKDQASPIDIAQVHAVTTGDKHDISGGGDVKGSMTTTQMLRDIKMGLADGAPEQLQAKARQGAQVLFHSSRDLQYRYAMSTVDDMAGILKQQHGVDLQAYLQGGGKTGLMWGTDKQIVGWIAQKLSGTSADVRAEVALALRKSSKDSTGVDMLKAAVWEIWSSNKLTDQQKAEAITGLIGAVRSEAISTVDTGDVASPAYGRRVARVVSGVTPTVETGKPIIDRGVNKVKEIVNDFADIVEEPITMEERTAIVKGIADRSGFKELSVATVNQSTKTEK